MPLESQEVEPASNELVPDPERVELTEWEDGEVSIIHTSLEGQWIRVEDPDLLIDPEDSQ